MKTAEDILKKYTKIGFHPLKLTEQRILEAMEEYAAQFRVIDPSIGLVIEERTRQINEEGFTLASGDKNTDGSMARAAACYALPTEVRRQYASFSGISGWYPRYWPWNPKWWKPSPDNRIRELAKAGALIIAEIARLLREADRQNENLNKTINN